MRHTIAIKKQVQSLRKKGFSLGDIFAQTHVPKTTIRLWIKNISLTERQQQQLRKNTQKALQKGRTIYQKKQKVSKNLKQRKLFSEGEKETAHLSKRESFLVGVALYWGEGFKNVHEHRLGFCNSDPGMASYYIMWLQQLGFKRKDFVLRLTINYSYKDKTDVIERYWSEKLKVPLNQFTKPFYQHTQWKKQYKTEDYYGVVRIHVKNSIELLWRMKGWIEGLRHAKIGSTHLPG